MKSQASTHPNSDWLLPGATKDSQSITKDWQFTAQSLIADVRIKEVLSVPKDGGLLTELFRSDWDLDGRGVQQVFQVRLDPGRLSAWHAHEFAFDRIFCNQGMMKLVLYDARQDSPTFGKINEFKIGDARPTLVVIPPRVWHGIQNISSRGGSMVNLVDKSYRYEDPDHWRLPWHSPEIPYSFQSPPTLPLED